MSSIREVDTTKTKINKENIIGELIQDEEIFGKMDPEKVRDPKTREHKLYRLAKNLNIIKEERLTEADFPQEPIASDIPDKVNNSVFRNLNPWEVFKNVPRFRYTFFQTVNKIWRNWDPSKDHIMSNDNPVPKSLTYQLHKYAHSIPTSICNFLSYAFFDWGSKYTTKVPNYPNTLAHQNGVFLFQSLTQSGYLRTRAMEFQLLACIGLVFFGPFKIPAIVATGYVLGIYLCFAASAQYAVIRVDFLPHTEQLIFTKSGYFGQLYPYAVSCKDLVRAEAKNLPYLPDSYIYDDFDQQLIFRDNSTGEFFAFPRLGVWSQEGLENPLLNTLLK